MPTPEKEEQVRQIKELIETSTVAIGTNNNGLSVADMTELRRVLRENGVRLRVVKNTLAHIAADEAGAPAVKEIVAPARPALPSASTTLPWPPRPSPSTWRPPGSP